MIPEEKEYIIMDRRGRDILTVRLINDESKIFIDEEEIMVCRAVAIPIPEQTLPELKEIESINDLIERMHTGDDENYPIEKIIPELDFFVNCSNLEAWVLHDYDSRLLDYRLSFPLLKTLVKHQEDVNPLILDLFLDELRQRYENGSDDLREYLRGEFGHYLNAATIPKAERNALSALQKYWSKEARHSSMGSLAGETIQDGYVVKFDARSVFKGIPKELAALEHLEELEVSYMSDISTMEFPAWLARMPHLRKIEMLHCSFKELDPSIGNLSSIESILLRDGRLERLPESFGNLTNLKSLIIQDTEFKELPESFGKLSSLETLRIAPQHGPGEKIRPQLKELPASFSELKNLKVLDLSYNRFTEFPEQITHLTSLEELNLGHNSVKEIPNEIGNLKELKILYLTSNKIAEIPEEFGELESLEQLHVNSNQIEYLPNTIGSLKNLKKIGLRSNNISLFPDWIRDLKSLNEISIGFNPIIELPNWIKQLPKLWRIAVNNTKIPAEKVEEYQEKFHPIEIFYK